MLKGLRLDVEEVLGAVWEMRGQGRAGSCTQSLVFWLCCISAGNRPPLFPARVELGCSTQSHGAAGQGGGFPFGFRQGPLGTFAPGRRFDHVNREG